MKITVLMWLILISFAYAQTEPIRLPGNPQISPDGKHIAFSWQKDIWTASTQGGTASRLTLNSSDDTRPHFSPDSTSIAFMSDRSGTSQVYRVGVEGGVPVQLTHDSNRKSLVGFTSDGKGLLIAQSTDRGWTRSESTRLFRIDLSGKLPKRMLFDAGFSDVSLSPDGTKVLFTRGRADWTRKGYRGAMALQLWLGDLSQTPATYRRLDKDRPHFQNVSQMNPMWGKDSATYYFVSDPDGVFDVYRAHIDREGSERMSRVGSKDKSDDGVAYASLSADDKTMLFRRRFDLNRLDLESGTITALTLESSGDSTASFEERNSSTSATDVAFTEDGKQMAFVADEDIYVMDRILKEPVRVTHDPFLESSLAFSSDGKRLFFVSDAGGEVDIWEASHEQEDGIWWLASEFKLTQVTEDRDVERTITKSPGSKHLAYVKGTNLFVMDEDGSDHRRIVQSWSPPSFDWSPDGSWVVYTTQDSDYNNDVWITPIDGTKDPFNLSRHPDSDGDPAWSRDGKRIAFVSQRAGDESDIYYINLTKEEEETTDRDTKLKEAIAAMKEKGSSKGKKGNGEKKDRKKDPSTETPKSDKPSQDEPTEDTSEEDKGKKEESEEDSNKVTIDFDGIHDRMHRISIPDSQEGGLIWSPDGKKLGFSASIDGERGFYTVEFPEVGTPKRMASSAIRSARWLKDSDEIVGLSGGGGGGGRGAAGSTSPASMSARGETTTFGFSARSERNWHRVREIAFDQGWRAMRDRFYDENMNNRDWEAIRKKYRPVAAQCLGADEFSALMNMMLGELNASHMGHRGGSDPLPTPSEGNEWTPTTYHLGLRYAINSEGPGLRVESVIPGSPCSRARSEVKVGESLMAIDGQKVGPEVDLDSLLTLDEPKDLILTVIDSEGLEREVRVRPTSSVQSLLYDEWVENARRLVSEQSDGTLGYLHIQGMNMPSFRQMEEDLYHAGDGKEGLVIDVRFNGGGSTTDHVLTALTQPVHAITKSRGSGEGYPQDRKIYASWSKPIVLMCNEYSFSNAEILSHAVKEIGRGRLVGMRTAGGVISTGAARLLDGSTVRMPTRGWYLIGSGEDMELNGCEPDIILWNPPDGADLQLECAVKALLEDVAAETAKGRVKIEPAAEKRRKQGPLSAGDGEGQGR